MLNALHDSIDEKEELREKSDNIIDAIIKKELPGILKRSENDLGLLFELLATKIADDLDELTTDAVRKGFERAKKRSEINGKIQNNS